MKKILKRKINRGDTLIIVITFMAVFLMMISAILSWVNLQYRLNRQKAAYEKSIHIAEAGVNYYRWHLAHSPTDYQDGTSGPGPYVHDFSDPYGEIIGQFSLEITPPPTSTTIVMVKSTGWTFDYPNIKRNVEVRYGIPTLAHYSFISNSNVWFGPTEHVVGELHSNGGIRMDGTNDSRVTSAKETYTCGPEHGCNYETKPGIWGAGGPQTLWDFPASNIDFDELTTDLSDLKDEALAYGFYLGESGENGYHVQFLADGTFNLYIVNETLPSWGWDEVGWFWRYIDIQTETPLDPINYPIPQNGIIFIEDNVWVDGTINGRVTLAAAQFPDTSETNKSIYINGNINYLLKNGSHALGLMAQKDVLIPRYSPATLNIDAIMLAQKGHCFRYYYPDNVLDSINVYGGIISNTTWTWNWDCGGWICSGFTDTHSVYDPYLTYSPPPSFPTTGEYAFISWEEKPYPN